MIRGFLKKVNSRGWRIISQTPRWIQYSGLAGMALSLVAIIATISYLKDATGLITDYNLYTTEFVLSVLSKKHLALFCLGLFVLSAIVTLGYFIVPWLVAFIETVMDAIFFKDSSKNIYHSEETVQGHVQSELQNEKHHDSGLTVDERIDRIKPLIVDCFWGRSLWRYGEDFTVKFCKSLKKILTEKKNVMKIGRIAYILMDNNWTAEKWDSFKPWIIAFFDALGMGRPGETAPNKYTYSKDGTSLYSSTFASIDNEFNYLLDEKYQAQLKKQRRPLHK